MSIFDLSEKIKAYELPSATATDGATTADTQKNGKRFEDYVIAVLAENGYAVTSAKDPSVAPILKAIKPRLAAEDQTITLAAPPTDPPAAPAPDPAPAPAPDKKLLIQQPYGSQYPPDILLLIVTPANDVHYQCVEVKTGGHRATWNNTYPKPNWIYVFSGTDGVTMFTGKHIMSESVLNLFEDYKNARKRLTDVYNGRLKQLTTTWQLVDYFKFEHRSCVKYKRDDDCEDREKEVLSLLQTFSQKGSTTTAATAAIAPDDDTDDDAESPFKAPPPPPISPESSASAAASNGPPPATADAADAADADDDDAESSLRPSADDA